jgi:dihydrolipoamide dehydrogenase
MADFDFDVLILGAGPGGYVAAIRASQLGLKAAVIEKDRPGGVCLNWGCIPSKALIHQAEMFGTIPDLEKMGLSVSREGFDYKKVYLKSRKAADTLSRGVNFLLKKNGVELIQGEGRLAGPHEISIEGGRRVTGRNVIIATGSRPREIPGFKIDEDRVLSSTGALSLQALPGKMLILGSGAVGVEFAHIFASFGVEIVIVEILDTILPLEDGETAQVLDRAFRKRKIKILTGTKAVSMKAEPDHLEIALEAKDGTRSIEQADKILVAVGRAANTENIGLESIGITPEKGFIPVGDYYQTAVPGIFAIGDVINTPLLAHVASREGEIAVEYMAGHNPAPRIDPMAIPGAVYTTPQVASFGLSEKRAEEMEIAYEKASFPYKGVGKAVATEASEGFIKVLFDPATHEILGAHAVGAEATEIIHEILLAKGAELLPADVAGIIHAHPTLSEGVKEAMLAVEGRAIHA